MNKHNLYEDALNHHSKKTRANKIMNEMFAAAQDDTGLNKLNLRNLKDYVHYYGRGWENGNPLVKEKGEKFPDRISTPFRHFAEVITTCAKAGKLDLLDQHLAALSAIGIDISFNGNLTKNSVQDVELLDTVIEKGSQLQSVICSHADSIKFDLAPLADNTEIAPKKKFKELVSIKYAIEHGDKFQKRLENLKRDVKLTSRVIEEDLKQEGDYTLNENFEEE